MSPEFVRAQLLRTRHRHEDAVAMLHSHLAHHPEDPDAFVELALNRTMIPGAEPLALQDARTASGLAPERPFPLSLQARILSSLNRPGDARRLAEAAIAMEPNVAYYWNTQSIVQCDMGLWLPAEASARTALSLEPDDGTASNLLSLSLRRQGRIAESELESRRRLSRDPDSAFPFYNLGQAAFRKKNFDEAEAFFLEALRLNPEMHFVREGLKETGARRYWIYRTLSPLLAVRKRMALRAAVVVFFHSAIAVGIWNVPAAAGIPLVPLIWLAAFGPWLNRAFGNLMLLRRSSTRSLLDAAQRLEAKTVAVCLVCGLLLVAVGLILRIAPVAMTGGGFFLAALPLTQVFGNPPGKKRGVLIAAAAIIFLIAGQLALDAALHPGPRRPEDTVGLIDLLITIILFACILRGDPRDKAAPKRGS
jgi:tetratricopeptide (TPR) repeat protein